MARLTGAAVTRAAEPITVAAPNLAGAVIARATEPITVAAPNGAGAVVLRAAVPYVEEPSALPWTYWDGAAELPVSITYWDGASELPLTHDQVT